MVMGPSTMMAKAAVAVEGPRVDRRHRGARPVHLQLRHQLLLQAVERRSPVRVKRLFAFFRVKTNTISLMSGPPLRTPHRASRGQGVQGRARPVHLSVIS